MRIIATDKYGHKIGDRIEELEETLTELEHKLEELETQHNIQLPIKERVWSDYVELRTQ